MTNDSSQVGLLDFKIISSFKKTSENTIDLVSISHGYLSYLHLTKTFSYLSFKQKQPLNITFESIDNSQNILSKLFHGIDTLLDTGGKVLCIPICIQQKSSLFRNVIISIAEKNKLLITPSGNNGHDEVLSPGIHPDVFCIGAVDKKGEIASFSGTSYNDSGSCEKPEISTLGVNVEIELNDGSFNKVNGTSFACTQVAGVAAAMFAENAEASVNDVKMALIESCTPAEGSRFGIINPEKALENIRTKVPYEIKFQPIPEPNFYHQKYIDYHLKAHCKRAQKFNKPVESLVVGQDTEALITRLQNKVGELLVEYKQFKNFDMAHIVAKPDFYDLLFEQPDLEVASAVDINYFDM